MGQAAQGWSMFCVRIPDCAVVQFSLFKLFLHFIERVATIPTPPIPERNVRVQVRSAAAGLSLQRFTAEVNGKLGEEALNLGVSKSQIVKAPI